MRIIYNGAVHHNNSWSVIGYNLVKALLKAGVEVVIVPHTTSFLPWQNTDLEHLVVGDQINQNHPHQKEGVLVAMGHPHQFPGFKTWSRPYIGISVWETNQLPEPWRSGLMAPMLHSVLLPSNFCVQSFGAICGERASLLPLGVDSNIFHEGAPVPFSAPERPPVFGMVGNAHPRKGVIEVVSLFKTMFGSPGMALLRIFLSRKDRLRLGDWIKHPNIEVVERLDEDRQEHVAKFLGSCDVILSGSYGEGFGLVLAEAMSMGRVVVGPDFGGHQDFLTPETGYPYEATKIKADYPEAGFGSVKLDLGYWTKPNPHGFTAAIQAILENKEDALKRALEGQRFVRQTYSWEKSAGLIIDLASKLAEANRTQPMPVMNVEVAE